MENSIQTESDFKFIGTGSQYFGIWIVNLLLSILTLGIYSAWAKVRRQQFFYQHTFLNNHRFDYTGDPIRILIGRIIAVTILVFQSVTQSFSPFIAGLLAIALFIGFPWLIKQTYLFTARNSRYRNIRFHFDGKIVGAYIVYLMWPLLAIVTLGLLTPLAHYAHKKYFFDSMRFGKHKARLNIGIAQMYAVYLKASLLFFAVIGGAITLLWFMNMGTNILSMPANQTKGIFFVLPMMFFGLITAWMFFNAQMTNLIWSNVKIANNYFYSRITTLGLLWITVSNWLLLSLTLGLFFPWAKVRMAKYRLENMGILWQDDPDNLLGSSQEDVSATGEEVADFLGFDLSL